MKQVITILISVGLWSCNGKTDTIASKMQPFEITGRTTHLTPTELNRLDSLNIDFQLRGSCYAYSSDKNAEASNGEAHSDNLPKKIDKNFPRQGLYLFINQNELLGIDSTILGCRLYLVNTADS